MEPETKTVIQTTMEDIFKHLSYSDQVRILRILNDRAAVESEEAYEFDTSQYHDYDTMLEDNTHLDLHNKIRDVITALKDSSHKMGLEDDL